MEETQTKRRLVGKPSNWGPVRVLRLRYIRLRKELYEYRLWGRYPPTTGKVLVALLAAIGLLVALSMLHEVVFNGLPDTLKERVFWVVGAALASLSALPLLLAALAGQPSPAEQFRLRVTAIFFALWGPAFVVLPGAWAAAAAMMGMSIGLAAVFDAATSSFSVRMLRFVDKMGEVEKGARRRRWWWPRWRADEISRIRTGEVEQPGQEMANWTASIYLGLDSAPPEDRERLVEATRVIGGPMQLVALWKEHPGLPGWIAACEESAAWFIEESEMIATRLRTSTQQIEKYAERVSTSITELGDLREARRLIAGLYRTLAKSSRTQQEKYLYLANAETFEPPPPSASSVQEKNN